VDDIDVAPSAPEDPSTSAGTEPDVVPALGDPPVPDTVAAPRNNEPFPTFRLGNLRLATITRAEAIAWILDQCHNERSCVVVTSNVFHLMLAERDPERPRGVDLRVERRGRLAAGRGIAPVANAGTRADRRR